MQVSLRPNGAPFAVSADQTLVVAVQGDYFLTIGAPLLGVEALPGSDATPGLRSAAIVWEGFNPRRRTLRSRATLPVTQVVPALPLRIEVRNGSTTFVNRTAVTVLAYTADADPAPLIGYAGRLRRAVEAGLPPPEGTATLRSAAHATHVRVVVPLLVTGTVGGRAVRAALTGRLIVPARGPIDVSVEPQLPPAGAPQALTGRKALAEATTLSLTVARLRQFERFLANPDPNGLSTTVYRYRTARPPRVPVAAQPTAHGRDWTTTLAVAAGLLLAAAAGLAVWARA